MTTPDVGPLERVDLRTAWQNKAGNFASWLAHEENLNLLGDAIGLPMEYEAVVTTYGRSSADILCRDTIQNHWVLVANQLERTDDTHLGQLITSAVDFRATTIIWIAEHITEQHRAALDWLNEIARERCFFGLEIELWKIGDSKPAPKLNIVSKPDGWSKKVPADGELGPIQKLRLDFWVAFQAFLDENHADFQITPSHAKMLAVPIGNSHVHLFVEYRPQQALLRVGLTCKTDQATANFAALSKQGYELEQEIGTELKWSESEDPKHYASHIYLNGLGPRAEETSTWPQYHRWLHEKLTAFRNAFGKRIEQLKLGEPSGG